MKPVLKFLSAAVLAALSTAAIADQSKLTRVAAVQAGAEITGLFIGVDGELFLNAQHPSDTNPAPYNKANLMVIPRADFAAKALPVPADADKNKVTTTLGGLRIIASAGDFDGVLGQIKAADGSTLLQSNDPDFNAFVAVDKDSGYLFTNWEDRPGGMSRIKLERDGNAWKATDAMMIDFTSIGGTWVNCFGTLSPWNTPLSAEELYFDNTADWNNAASKYFADQQNLEKHLGKFPNPYRYGYIVEVTDPAGTPKPVKKFAMGRFSHENAVVMPDNKTVYLSDDGTDVVFFKFVADKAGDLSAGTLYAAKVTQEEGSKDPAVAGFGVEWIELAHATEADVEKWIAEYDAITPEQFKEGETSYISDADIAAWAEGKAKDNRVAFLESRKAAAAKGATAEFRKMEGVNTNAKVPGKVFMAMSEISKGMSDDKGDVQLDQNKCGVVYEMDADENQNITHMKPLVAGMGYNKAAEVNQCSVDSVSNPDNLLVLDNGDVLIGEDTSKHENNMLWVYKR